MSTDTSMADAGTEACLPRLMADAGQAFAQHCLSDPTFEIALLATSPHFTTETGRNYWGVRAWTGKNRTVRPERVPEGADLRRVTGAVIAEQPWANFAMWMFGAQPTTGKVTARMFVDAENVEVLAEYDRWASGLIANFAHDLAQLG
jgi:hypothetical protein